MSGPLDDLTSAQRLDALVEISCALGSLDITHVLDVTVDRLPALLRANAASVYFLDADAQELQLMRASDGRELEATVSRDSDPAAVMWRAVDTRSVLAIPDFKAFAARQSPPVSRAHAEHYHTDSCVVVPLTAGDAVLGVLNITGRADGVPFGGTGAHDETAMLQVIGSVAGVAIRSFLLYNEVQGHARHDAMTRMANHNTFLDVLAQEVERCQRYASTLSVALIDVDNFRQFNDALGHACGDYVVKSIARVIRGCLRNVDQPARYGGDEFAIILPETTLDESAHVIDRMYERILAHRFEWKGQELTVGLSIGVSQYAGQKTAHDLVSHVDDFLHHAKQAGKGRVSYDAKSNQPRTEATS